MLYCVTKAMVSTLQKFKILLEREDTGVYMSFRASDEYFKH